MKQIYRQTHIRGGSRQENDAEHSWHLALMAFLLEEYANEPVDITRVMKMVLIHDLVEVDAGDTYAYDTAGKCHQKAEGRSRGGPDFSVFFRRIRERCSGSSGRNLRPMRLRRARFAHVMDNFQPMTLNDDNGGGDWKRASGEEVSDSEAE